MQVTVKTNHELIEHLKDAGFNVYIEHFRNFYGEPERYYRRGLRVLNPDTKGGATIVRLEKRGGTFIGIAICSDEDNYCYKLGVQIALERALANYQNFLDFAKELLKDDKI